MLIKLAVNFGGSTVSLTPTFFVRSNKLRSKKDIGGIVVGRRLSLELLMVIIIRTKFNILKGWGKRAYLGILMLRVSLRPNN